MRTTWAALVGLSLLGASGVASAQTFTYSKEVSAQVFLPRAGYFDLDQQQVTLFPSFGSQGQHLNPDGTSAGLFTVPSNISSQTLVGAAYDQFQKHVILLTSTCVLSDNDPMTLATLSMATLPGVTACTGLAKGRDNKLYVIDTNGPEVVIFDRKGAGQLSQLSISTLPGADGITAIPGSDNLLITSSSKAMAMVLSITGDVVTAAAPIGQDPLNGSGNTRLITPNVSSGVCVNGHVWVCDRSSFVLMGCADYGPTGGDFIGCGCDVAVADSCPPEKPFCDKTSLTCRGCASDTDCGIGATPACITDTQTCAMCSATNKSLCKGTTPACDPTTHLCSSCKVNADCPSSTPVCNNGTSCVLCTPGPTGNALGCQATNQGNQCLVDTMTGTVFCGCTVDGECPSGYTCDTTVRTCQPPASAASSAASSGASTGTGTGGSTATGTGSSTGTGTTGCTMDADCASMTATPHCLTSGTGGSGACVECSDDAQCAGRADGKTSCSGPGNTCEAPAKQCTADDTSACSKLATGAACLPSGKCGCNGALDCAANRTCSLTSHTCVSTPPSGDGGGGSSSGGDSGGCSMPGSPAGDALAGVAALGTLMASAVRRRKRSQRRAAAPRS